MIRRLGEDFATQNRGDVELTSAEIGRSNDPDGRQCKFMHRAPRWPSSRKKDSVTRRVYSSHPDSKS